MSTASIIEGLEEGLEYVRRQSDLLVEAAEAAEAAITFIEEQAAEIAVCRNKAELQAAEIAELGAKVLDQERTIELYKALLNTHGKENRL